MAIRHFTCSFLVCLLAISSLTSQTGVGSTAVEQEVQSGEIALRQGQYEEAKRHFERAESLGLHSAEINAGIAIVDLQMGQYEAARQREAKVLDLVSNDHQRAEAHNLIGTAWQRESEEHAEKDKLHAAEESFQRAIRLDPAFDMPYFNLGNLLLRQNREAEAGAAFKNFIGAAAKDPATERDAPIRPSGQAVKFSVTDSVGRGVSSDSLRGRFVLLDFWATWCPPCIRALPVMRQLARYFPPEQFVLISVDEDSTDQDVWRKFITQQKMDWTQVWDKDSDVYYGLGLARRPDMSIPRYVLLDRDGFVRWVYTGTDRLGLVAGQVVKAVTAAPMPAQEPGKPPSSPAAAGPDQ